MLVKEIMTKNVVIVPSKKTVYTASLLYKDLKIGSILISDNGKINGIITERDIIERTICEKKNPEKTKVSEIMTKKIISIHPLDTVEEALDKMKRNNIKKLPVIKNDKVAGIITITDISKARPDLSKRFIDSWVKPMWKD